MTSDQTAVCRLTTPGSDPGPHCGTSHCHISGGGVPSLSVKALGTVGYARAGDFPWENASTVRKRHAGGPTGSAYGLFATLSGGLWPMRALPPTSSVATPCRTDPSVNVPLPPWAETTISGSVSEPGVCGRRDEYKARGLPAPVRCMAPGVRAGRTRHTTATARVKDDAHRLKVWRRRRSGRCDRPQPPIALHRGPGRTPVFPRRRAPTNHPPPRLLRPADRSCSPEATSATNGGRRCCSPHPRPALPTASLGCRR